MLWVFGSISYKSIIVIHLNVSSEESNIWGVFQACIHFKGYVIIQVVANKNIYLGLNCISMRRFEFSVSKILETWLSLNLMNINSFAPVGYLLNLIGL